MTNPNPGNSPWRRGRQVRTPNNKLEIGRECSIDIDVYAATIPDFPYQAGVHVNYQETKLRIEDGLPKLKDVPKELGGSGIAIAE